MSLISFLRVLTALALIAAFVLSAEARTWTNFEGKQIEADYVRLNGLNVVLRMQGREVSVPLEKLSDADKQFVFQQQIGGANPAESPFAPVGEGDSQPAESAAGETTTATAPRKSTKSESTDGVARMRSWKDNTGKTIRAKFIRIHGENAVLMQGAKTVSCAVADLSTEDQEYLRQLLTARGEGHLMPSPEQLASARQSGDGDGAGSQFAGGYNPGAGASGYTPTPSYTPPYTVDAATDASSTIPPGMTDPTLAAQAAADAPYNAPYDASGAPSTTPSSGYSGYAGSNAAAAPYTASSAPSYGSGSSSYSGSGSSYSGGYTGMTDPASTTSGYPGPTDMASNMPTSTPYSAESSMPSTPFQTGADWQVQTSDQGVAYYCSGCGKEVPEHINDKCPHCGIRFDYVEEPDGSRRYNPSYYIGSGVGILVAIIGVIVRVIVMAQRR